MNILALSPKVCALPNRAFAKSQTVVSTHDLMIGLFRTCLKISKGTILVLDGEIVISKIALRF
jgi:hypothetical protein